MALIVKRKLGKMGIHQMNGYIIGNSYLPINSIWGKFVDLFKELNVTTCTLKVLIKLRHLKLN